MTETRRAGQTCPHCGALLEPTPKFCEACGKAVGRGDRRGARGVRRAQPARRRQPDQRRHGTPGYGGPGGRRRPARAVPAVRRRGRRRRLLHPVRHQGARTRATTSRSSPRRGWPGSATAGSGTTATRTRWRWPSTGRASCWSSATASPTPSTPHIGSMNAAHAVLDVLRPPLPRGLGVPESRDAAITKAVHRRGGGRAEGHRRPPCPRTSPTRPPARSSRPCSRTTSCTTAGSATPASTCCPTPATGRCSPSTTRWRSCSIAGGTPRAEAEASKQAHSITKWLGKDSAEIVPRVGQVEVTGPGWLLACSDGLWNYASEPAALKAQIAAAGSDDPLAVARHLVAFANASGGQDNITAALARVGRPLVEDARARACLTRRTRVRNNAAPTEGRPMAEFTATVLQNEFLPDGGTDVHAIVTVDCSGRRHRRPDGLRRGRRDHHHRHLGLDGAVGDGGRQAGGPGGAGRDRRRHVLRRDLRQRRGLPRLPAGQRGPGDGADERGHPGRGRGRDLEAALRRRHRDLDLARHGRRAVHVRARRSCSGTRSC